MPWFPGMGRAAGGDPRGQRAARLSHLSCILYRTSSHHCLLFQLTLSSSDKETEVEREKGQDPGHKAGGWLGTQRINLLRLYTSPFHRLGQNLPQCQQGPGTSPLRAHTCSPSLLTTDQRTRDAVSGYAESHLSSARISKTWRQE